MDREDLKRMRELHLLIGTGGERLKVLQASSERTTQLLTGLPMGSTFRSKVEESVCQMQALLEELERQYDELRALEAELTRRITPLKELERMIIRLRYIDNQSWVAIARMLNRSTSLVYQKHRQAVWKILQPQA